MQLDPIHNQYGARLVTVAIHIDIARGHRTQLHNIHGCANFKTRRCLSHPQRLKHLALAFRRSPVVRAHAGRQKRRGSVVTQPIAHGADNRWNLIDSTAAPGNRHLALRNIKMETIELVPHVRGQVGQRIGYQFLTNTK